MYAIRSYYARWLAGPQRWYRRCAVITEVAMLDVVPGREAEFERAFGDAQRIIAMMPGYLGHELKRCIENSSRYLLLVRWRRLEDHT